MRWIAVPPPAKTSTNIPAVGARSGGDVATHCATQPDLWQVSVDFEGVPSTLWFTVRWRPPHKFSMVNVSDADGSRTLFPVSGWH